MCSSSVVSVANISEPVPWSLWNICCCLSCTPEFLNFEKKMHILIFHDAFFSVFIHMGPHGKKNFKTQNFSLISRLSFSNLLLNFLLNRLHNSTVLKFWNFNFPFLGIFPRNFSFTIVSYSGKKSRNYVEKEPSPAGSVFGVYRSVFNVSLRLSQVWVNFRQPCASKLTGRRMKRTKIENSL